MDKAALLQAAVQLAIARNPDSIQGHENDAILSVSEAYRLLVVLERCDGRVRKGDDGLEFNTGAGWKPLDIEEAFYARFGGAKQVKATGI